MGTSELSVVLRWCLCFGAGGERWGATWWPIEVGEVGAGDWGAKAASVQLLGLLRVGESGTCYGGRQNATVYERRRV